MDTEQSSCSPNAGIRPSRFGLAEHGIRNINVAYWNLGAAQLLEHAVRRHEGLFASGGSYVVRTGQFTGRSPKDKFIVRDETTEDGVQWGPINQPMGPASFDRLYSKMLAYWQGHDLFVQDCYAGADPRYSLPIRVVSQYAWHALFARQLFVRADPGTPRITCRNSPFSSPRVCRPLRPRMERIPRPASWSTSPGA